MKQKQFPTTMLPEPNNQYQLSIINTVMHSTMYNRVNNCNKWILTTNKLTRNTQLLMMGESAANIHHCTQLKLLRIQSESFHITQRHNKKVPFSKINYEVWKFTIGKCCNLPKKTLNGCEGIEKNTTVRTDSHEHCMLQCRDALCFGERNIID